MNARAKEIIYYMPENLNKIFSIVFEDCGDLIQEIRLRNMKPLVVETLKGCFFVSEKGKISCDIKDTYNVKPDDIRAVFHIICENSVYAYLEDIKQGFITLKGGHRIGFTGKAVCNRGKIESLKDISSINIRIAREYKNCSKDFIKYIIDDNKIKSTLFVSPPMCGKTTIIRDVARELSNRGFKVGIADDRGEIAAMYKGIPQNDVGIHTDVIENAPKKEAISMMLRTMSPKVIISDEISNMDDSGAVMQCFGTGVKVMGSAHGNFLEDVVDKSFLKPLIGRGGFENIIVLSMDGEDDNIRINGKLFDVSYMDRGE